MLRQFRIFALFFFVVMVGLGLLSQARAQNCYTRGEAEAEQALRIHSELMVIGLNCQGLSVTHGMNLYQKYQEFSQRHAALFAGYEDVLMNYYRRSRHPKPEAALHSLRTAMANEISDIVAESRPDRFCTHYADRVIQASGMSTNDIRTWAQTIYPGQVFRERTCF